MISTKKLLYRTITALGTVNTTLTNVQTALGKCPALVVTQASVSSLPATISNANIESDMVAVKSKLSDPSAQVGDWTVTTSAGSLTISGTINGTTDVTLYLMKSR